MIVNLKILPSAIGYMAQHVTSCFLRDGDGRKVLRSSIREFLCSEAMAALGIPSTRAASLVTSDLYVSRDPLNSGKRVPERCSVVLRLAPSFIRFTLFLYFYQTTITFYIYMYFIKSPFPFLRFGSFEIFLGRDKFSGLQGPSAALYDIRSQLLDYVIETFYPDIQQEHNRRNRNMAFFREVSESVLIGFINSGILAYDHKVEPVLSPGDDTNGQACGPVAMCWILSWRP